MTIKQIGRITLLKFSAFSALIIFLLPIPLRLVAFITGDTTGSVLTFYQNLFEGLLPNIVFIIIETAIIICGIWIIGAKAGERIIKKKQKKFMSGFLTILSLWGWLFVTSTLTSGLLHSIKYGWDGFLTTVMNWFAYGFLLYFFLGLIHSLLGGHFLGKKIYLLGQKYESDFLSADA